MQDRPFALKMKTHTNNYWYREQKTQGTESICYELSMFLSFESQK